MKTKDKHPSSMGELRNRVAIWGACSYTLAAVGAPWFIVVFPIVAMTLPAISYAYRYMQGGEQL